MKKVLYLLIILLIVIISYLLVDNILIKDTNPSTEGDITTESTETPSTNEKTQESIIAQEVLTTTTATEITTEEQKKQEKIDSNDPNFPSCHDLELKLIEQYPELPAGCESVSLTMLLNYYGFDLDKQYIVDNHLIYSGNFVLGYCGDPYSYSVGGGCYAPGMTDTANDFLTKRKSNFQAVNITGTEFDEVFEYIAAGHPVLVWTTINMAYPNKSYYEYDNDGNVYGWDTNEHCVVLTGYDYKANTVTIYDPIAGIIYRDMDAFKDTYDSMYQMAIIIKEN